jgi:general secretion pathway protein A
MKEHPDYQQALRAIWGAHSIPFGAEAKELYSPPEREELARRIDRFIALNTTGMITGANGSGKTILLENRLDRLNDKYHQITRISHSTLTGSDLIRRILRLNGLRPSIRRADNLHVLLEYWRSDARKPLLFIDEAQNLTPAALEELRLLLTEAERNKTAFALLLCGDEELPVLASLNVHRPLRSRLAYHLQVKPFSREQTAAYSQFRWQQTGVAQDPIQPQALALLHSASEGLPRIINLIAQNAILDAADHQQHTITEEHITRAIDQVPGCSCHLF